MLYFFLNKMSQRYGVLLHPNDHKYDLFVISAMEIRNINIAWPSDIK